MGVPVAQRSESTSPTDTLEQNAVPRGTPGRSAGSGSNRTAGARPDRNAGPRIWAIASGKGGVGKSVVISSLAIAFARRGRRCALLDLDLGGANLHTLLGVPRLRPNLSDFMQREVSDLSEVLSATGVPNLFVASGERSAADAANPKHSQKQKLIRHIRTLPVDEVFLDLGAGSAYHVLDFFLAADHGMLLVTPEPTAIENTYHLLKTAFFRSLRSSPGDPEVDDALKTALSERSSRGVRSPRDLVRAVSQIDPAAGERLSSRVEGFAPTLLVNQVRDRAQRNLGARLARECRAHLGAELKLLGSISADEHVPLAVQRGEPILRLYPGGSFATDIEALARHLLTNDSPMWDRHGDVPTDLRVALDPTTKPTGPIDLDAPGAALRKRREELGLRLEALTQRTRIRCLEGIEMECFDQLPPEPYIRGFVQQYAQVLGISEHERLAESFIARYRGARGDARLRTNPAA
jgi:flagellar biosynthesis protein FlhG